jgi:N-acetylmuramoyl-L-alanine amidase
MILASTLLLAGYVSAEPAPTTAVTGVRFWSFGDTTRIVIEATGEVLLQSDRVPNPDRLFFDFMGARMRLGRRGQHSIPVGDRLLRQIRVAQTSPEVTRVVFDLETGVDYTASQLTNPSRLIIELKPAAPGTQPVFTAPSTPLPVSEISFGKVAELAKPAGPQKTSIGRIAAKPVAEPKLAAVPPLPEQTARIDTLPEPANVKESAAVKLTPPRPAKLGGSHSLTRVLGLKVGRIVIDPGHGGHDTGTAGHGGLLEKDLVLDVAKRLGSLIETRMGAEVIYTRSDDTFIPLETRTLMANNRKADLFLSIHANSSPARSSSGVETYYLNFTTSRDAMEVAARENASSQRNIYELKDEIRKIAMNDKVDESREFAEKLQRSLYAASARANGRTRDRGVKKAPFVVLIGASMPSVLAELGFISNPKDEALFKKANFRQRIAEGLYKGLAQYAGSLSQFQFAQK